MRSYSKRVAAVAAVALGLACDESLIGTGPTADAYVTTGSNYFSPTTVTIRAGQAVLWAFGSGTHNVLFDAVAGAPANCSLTSAGTCRREFPTPGSYGFICGPHASAGMAGTVVVNP